MAGEGLESGTETARPAHLRLVWRNPCPPVPRAPIDLAAAIERHLTGHDGLTDAQFLKLYARREVGDRPALAVVS